MTDEELREIRRLVGDVSVEQLRYVDCFVGGGLGVFIPSVGPCDYATTPDHIHPAYSFILMFDIYTRLSVNGRILTSRPGEIMAIDPDAVHHEVAGDEPPRYMAVMVDRALFEEERLRYADIRPSPFNFRTFPAAPELMSMLKDFMNEAEARLPARNTVLSAIGVRIVHTLIRSSCGIATAPDRVGSRVEIHRAIEHIQHHAADKLSVNELAAVAGMSPSHFSRVFRHETGRTPLSYVNRVRIEHARKLLRAGGDSISSVAMACGYSSPSHFAEAFRRTCGQTPSEFLRSVG